MHSLIGSFVVLLVLCDCIGPSQRFQFPLLTLKSFNIPSSNEMKGGDSVGTNTTSSDETKVQTIGWNIVHIVKTKPLCSVDLFESLCPIFQQSWWSCLYDDM